MQNSEMIKKHLEEKLAGSSVSVQDMTGTDDHLELDITWDGFAGLTLIKQHRLVMDELKEALAGPVHAVKINTKTK